MVCVYCGSPTQVINSRSQRRANHIWRRRKCTACAAVFTTEEHTALHSSLMVQDAEKKLLPFSRDHLFTSVHDSCRHRRSSIDDAGALTQTIITELLGGQAGGIIARDTIASVAHAVLQRFDTAAATFYAAYHPVPLKQEEPTAS